MEFLEYICSLAVEGETALVVKQKPTLVAGEQQYHKDGAIKCTWPAYLPEKYSGKGAWYINNGSFILDRFVGGRVAASASNSEFVLFMVLDDVGTKSKVPSLEPTWRMETSEGNEQWGYAFSDGPTKGEYCAAYAAIAEAGFTDAGAGNPVRNVRLPGSVNIKPGKNNFQAKLLEFNPEREYTLSYICTALGVEPKEANTAVHRSIALADDGNDVVLAWLAKEGHIIEKGNGSGWWGVTCPNASEHSDGNPMGRYNPANRAYCCYHEHCHDWNSEAFLHWVEEQGGPSQSHGLRDDLLATAMAPIYEKIVRGDKFSAASDAAALLEQVERNELGRLTRSELFDRFAFVLGDGAFFDLGSRQVVGRADFDALYRGTRFTSIHAGPKGTAARVQASIFFDENRQAKGARTLHGLTYAPGETELVAQEGLAYGNRWVNARQPGKAGTVAPWLRHCEQLLPNEAEREHIFNVLAYKVQHPNVKINHALLIGGSPGVGKDTMLAPFFHAVCGPYGKNKSLVDTKSLESQWGYDYEVEVMVINELRPDAFKDRRALENTLKPIIAAPPDQITINRKGMHPYQALNRLLVVAFSNFRDAIALPSDDRRWYCAWAEGDRMPERDAISLWRWYRDEGFDHISAWLALRDVSKFNPAAAPPMTEAKRIMIEQARTGSESYLIDMIEMRQGDFAAGVIAAPFYKLLDRLQGAAPTGAKVSPNILHHALAEAGWADLGRLHCREYATKKRIFAAPAMVKQHSKSDLRRMAEEPAQGLSVVK